GYDDHSESQQAACSHLAHLLAQVEADDEQNELHGRLTGKADDVSGEELANTVSTTRVPPLESRAGTEKTDFPDHEARSSRYPPECRAEESEDRGPNRGQRHPEADRTSWVATSKTPEPLGPSGGHATGDAGCRRLGKRSRAAERDEWAE